MQSKDKKTIKLHCKFMKNHDLKQESTRIPCHGLLDHRLLAALHASGVEHIHLYGINQCKACPSRVGNDRLSRTLSQMSPEMQKHSPCIHTNYDDADLSLAATTANTPSPERPTNRRSFLNKVADISVQTAVFSAMNALPFTHSDCNEKTDISSALKADQYRKKHIPQTHQLALFSLDSDHLAVNNSANILSWFHEIRPQGICDVCGICALHCPTGALLIEDSEQSLDVQHKPAACIGCGLCVSLCPMQSLRLDGVDDNAVITENQVFTLFHCSQKRCAACGGIFAVSGLGDTVCPSCSNEKHIEDDIFGERGEFRTHKPGR